MAGVMIPLARAVRRFRLDRRGVSAVEFALIAPILILLYFGLAELASAMMAQRRVSHAASAVGDLVAQSQEIKSTTGASSITNVFAAATAIVKPFPTTPLKLRVTSITANAAGNPRVDWSDGQTGLAAYSHCAVVAGLPTGLLTAAGESVIMAEATYTYTSPVASVIPNGLSFSEKFYLRPRQVTRVPREGASTTACTS